MGGIEWPYSPQSLETFSDFFFMQGSQCLYMWLAPQGIVTGWQVMYYNLNIAKTGVSTFSSVWVPSEYTITPGLDTRAFLANLQQSVSA